MSESTLHTGAQNAAGLASGIFQLMPDTARGLGWMKGDARWDQIASLRSQLKQSINGDAVRVINAEIHRLQSDLMAPFLKLTPAQQLVWAAKYYAPHKGLLVNPGACYVANFLPAELPNATKPLHVLCSPTFRPSAYEGNWSAFDYKWAVVDGHKIKVKDKGYINVSDMTKRYNEVTVGQRWTEFANRVRAAVQERDTDPAVPTDEEISCTEPVDVTKG